VTDFAYRGATRAGSDFGGVIFHAGGEAFLAAGDVVIAEGGLGGGEFPFIDEIAAKTEAAVLEE
jgi:hypothetical protein